MGNSRLEDEIPTHPFSPQEFWLEPIPLKEAPAGLPQIHRAAKVDFEPLDWSYPERPLEVKEKNAPSIETKSGQTEKHGASHNPEVVTDGFDPLLSDSLMTMAEALVLRPESGSQDLEVYGIESRLAEIEENRLSSDEHASCHRGFDLSLDAFELDSEKVDDGGVQPTSVDARISAWNPSWLESLTSSKEADEAIPEKSSAAAAQFLTSTEWIAPAASLGTISTCLGDSSFPRPTSAYAASITSSQTEERNSSPPRFIEPAELPEVPRRPQVSPDSTPVRKPGLEEPKREPASSRPSELAGSPATRSIEASERIASVELPSVEDIMAAHGRFLINPDAGSMSASSVSASSRPKRVAVLAAPSVAVEPECWELPLWLAWPPLAFVSMLVGIIGCGLSWIWMQDARNASIVANRLLGKEAEMINGRPIPLPEWVVMPSPSWYRSTPRHLIDWAAYLGRSAESNERTDEIRGLLSGALAASPTYAPARLTLARMDESGGGSANPPTTAGLGLSRDPIALAWAGQSYLKAGRKDVALPLYRQALALATQPELTPETFPTFSEEAQGKRYLLPGEEVVGRIVSGLVAERSLSFTEWSTVLPEGSVAPLVAARLLREQNRRDSEASLDMILGREDRAEEDGTANAIRHAVRAEAFALRAKWKDAEREYYAAIDRIDHDATHRSWWYNLAEIEHRLKDQTQRQEAIKKALASTSTSDEIARRAADLRRNQAPSTAEEAPRVRGTGLKAN